MNKFSFRYTITNHPKLQVVVRDDANYVDPRLNGMLPFEADDLVHRFVPTRVRFVPFVRVRLMRNYCTSRIHTT